MERDADNIEMELAKAIYMSHWKEGLRVWGNATAEMREWSLVQARAGLKRLEEAGIIEKERVRVR